MKKINKFVTHCWLSLYEAMSVLVRVGVHILCSNGADLNMQCYTGNNSLFYTWISK